MKAWTYQDLIAHAQAKAAWNESTQGMRNRLSALTQYLEAQGLDYDSEVGQELTSAFDRTMVDLVAQKKKAGASDGTIANLRSYLGKWKDLWPEFQEVQKAPNFGGFGEAFSYYLQAARTSGSKISLATLARMCGKNALYFSTINRKPETTRTVSISVDTVSQVEEALGAPPGSLSRYVKVSDEGLTKRGRTFNLTDYRQRIAGLIQDPYALRELPAQLKEEVQGFIRFKTCAMPVGLVRNERWRTQPNALFSDGKELLSLVSVDGTTFSSSAVKFVCDVRRFFGFLANKQGMDPDRFSLVYMCDLELLALWLDFIRGRVGVLTQGPLSVLQQGGSLLYEKGGWIRQQPQFASRLPNPVPSSEWEAWCAKRREVINEVESKQYSDKTIQTGRDTEEAIREILQRDHPVTALLDMADEMNRYLVKYESQPDVMNSVGAATLKRDILIIRILTVQPLRANMIRMMTYRKDNKGNLYRRQDGRWAIKFKPSDFKNERGAAADKPYDVPLPAAYTAEVDRYLDEVRPVLKPTTNCVFVAARTRGKERNGTYQKWVNLMIRTRSRQFIKDCIGFGPHSIRHIVATDYIKNNPGSFMVAAHILHDKLETVLKAYAHLKAADGHRIYQAYLSEVESTWKAAR